MVALNQSANGLEKARRWIPLGLCLLLMLIGFWRGWYSYFTFENLVIHREQLSDFVEKHFLLALGGYGLIYLFAVALSFPGASFLTIAGGLLFGWLIGGATTVLAATLGACVIFLAARSAFGGILRAKAGGFVERFSDGFSRDALNYLLFLRLVPIFPFWLVNIVPAFFRIRLRTYFIATLLGIMPGTFAYAVVGGGLDSVIDAQRAANPDCIPGSNCSFVFDSSKLITNELIIAFIVLGLVSLIPPMIKLLKNRQAG